MIRATNYIRVRYEETDQMGFVYYGNYATYFEVARVELFRGIGLSYRKLEEAGVMMPVINLMCKYHHPAKYDDLLKIVTEVPEIPTGVRINFNYKIYNEQGLLLHEGSTELVFVNMENSKPMKAPKILLDKLILNFKTTKK